MTPALADRPVTGAYFVGVNLGAAKIRAGVLDGALRCAAKAKLSTKPERGKDAVVERIARCVRYALDEADLDLKQVGGIGIGVPGTVDRKTGSVLFAPNLAWRNVSLKKELEKLLNRPVFVANDCDATLFGVYVAELGSEPQRVIGIFIGTGIGGALILHGEPYAGPNPCAAQIGHMVLAAAGPKCGCGNKGCFEALASRTAIFQKIADAVKAGQKTVLTEMLGDRLEGMRSGDLRRALRRGDKLVERVVEEAAEYVGIAVANLINILHPEVVVLGGGVIQALGGKMMRIVEEFANDCILEQTSNDIEILVSKLGDQAPITGAALLAGQELI